VRRNSISGKSFLGIVFIVLLGLSSCKTTRVVTTTPSVTPIIVKPIGAGKLIRSIENNAFDYKYLSIKKISCQFDNGKTKMSFKASIQVAKDKEIVIMVSKINIPVARLWLTPDSVKSVNFMDDTYVIDDYSYLSSVLGMDVDFQTVNAIVSNDLLSLDAEKNEKDNREYETTIDSGMYVLQSVKNLKTDNVKPKIRERKLNRTSKKLVEGSPVRQWLYVDPVTFKLRKMKVEDAANSRNLSIEFSDFAEIKKQLYPGEIFLHFFSPDNNMQMRMKLSNFSMEEEKSPRFKVPENFTRTLHD
jgi:hypothetical protein